jgi:ankyrin repeat protein
VDRCGDPLLHVAIRKGHLALARRLCEMGAVPELRDSHGDTALHCAVKRPGALALARWIAERACASKDGAGRRLLDTRDERNGDTVLALAVKLGQEELALFFLARGAEPALEPRRWGLGLAPGHASASQQQQDDPCAGDLPLQIAIKMRMAALAEAIVGACSENDLMRPDAEGRPALTLALSHGLLQLALVIANIVRARLGVNALDAPCAKGGSTALHVALHRGLVMFAATLVELGASVNAQTKAGHSALHCCVELIGSSSNSGGSSSSDLSSRSISPAGADKGLLQQQRQPPLPQAATPAAASSSPLALPLLAGLLTLLPSKKVDTRLRTGEQRLTALHLCVKGDRLPAARLLLDKCGAQLADDTDREGNSALALAVLRAHVPMVQLLLDSGAGFDKVNKASLSPLHLAAQQPHPENSRDMARLLLNRGASPSVWDAQGRCPLHYAAERNLGDLIHTFALHCKVPGHLELRTEEGLTALMLAVRGGCVAATAALLEARVDLRHKAPGTRATALHLASALSADRKRPFWGSGVAEMLIEHCASTAVGPEGGAWDVDAAGVSTSDALEQLRRRVGFKEPEQLQTAVPASPHGAKQILVVKPATASPASSPGPPSASASPPSVNTSPASASPASAAAVLATATVTTTTAAQSAPPLLAKVVLAQPSAPPLPPRAGVSSAQPVLAPTASVAKPAAGAALTAGGAITGVGAFASAVAAKALAEGHAEPASAGSADPAHDAADESSSRDEPSLPVRAQLAPGSSLPAAGALRRHRPLHERARREGEAVALDWLATEQGQALLRKRAARLQQRSREPLSDALALARARAEFVAKQADTIADRLLA